MTHTAKTSLQQGDIATVEKNLKIAKICVILGWVWCVLCVVLWLVWFLFMGGLALVGGMPT